MMKIIPGRDNRYVDLLTSEERQVLARDTGWFAKSRGSNARLGGDRLTNTGIASCEIAREVGCTPGNDRMAGSSETGGCRHAPK
jgi:hypothetical protein